jgi:hypothetical protein
LTGHFLPLIIEIGGLLPHFRSASRRGWRATYPTDLPLSHLAILIGLVLLVLATFVIAFFASRAWHWAYVLVVVGIVLSSAGAFILGAEVLRIQNKLRPVHDRFVRDLDAENARIAALREGTDDSRLVAELRQEGAPDDVAMIPSLGDLEHLLLLETHVRGREWRNVQRGQFDPQTGAVVVGFASPPAWLAQGAAPAVVYLFEEGDPSSPDPSRGAQYLGEFRVTQAGPQSATLTPTLPLEEYERQRLANSNRPWVIYETMPADRHKIFAGLAAEDPRAAEKLAALGIDSFRAMTEDELRQKLPAATVEEYIRHGQPAGEDDDEWHRAWYDEEGRPLSFDDRDRAARVVFRRPLRDYAWEFRKLAEQRAVLQAHVAALETDNRLVEEALADARALAAFREEEIRKHTSDAEGLARDLQALAHHTEQVQRQLDRLRALVDQTLRQNGQMARDLAARQAELTSAINRAMAAGDGSPAPAGAGQPTAGGTN